MTGQAKAPQRNSESSRPSTTRKKQSIARRAPPTTRQSQRAHTQLDEDIALSEEEFRDIEAEEYESDGSNEEKEENEHTPVYHTPVYLATVEDRSRFGCTCGRCIEGFLSPRMAFALECQANTLGDTISEDIYYMAPRVLYEWWEDVVLQDVPEIAQRSMRRDKSLWKGFARLFGHVADCVRSGKLPTTDNVLPSLGAEWNPESRKFLNSGGTVASVVLACFEHVFAHSIELGDGTHDETFRRDIMRIRACKNDKEYKMARKGYQRFEGVDGKKWWRDLMGPINGS